MDHIKMQHICTVQALADVLGRKYRFEDLEKKTVTELQDLRDSMVPEYNKKVLDFAKSNLDESWCWKEFQAESRLRRDHD
jgi:hypothetical protein